MDYEFEILKRLTTKYRNSAKNVGAAKTNRKTSLKPTEIIKNYGSPHSSFDESSAFNKAVDKIEDEGFIKVLREEFGTSILEIVLNDEKVVEAEQYLSDKYGVTTYSDTRNRLQNIIDEYSNDDSRSCSMECKRLEGLLENRKPVKEDMARLEDTLKAASFIEHNKRDLYLREASMLIFGTSKRLDSRTDDNLLDSVCRLLRKSLGVTRSEGEPVDEVLERWHIHKEPEKIRLKGDAIIRIAGKEADISPFKDGIEFLASEDVESVILKTRSFMTVENKTSYLRYSRPDTTLFYLGGQPNRFQEGFIRRVYQDNPNAEYLHFGDIDIGGFWIHNSIKNATGAPFKLFHMGVEDLMDERFRHSLQTLSDEDWARIDGIRNIPEYAEVTKYMEDNNIKLEQEIISLMLTNEEETVNADT